MDELRGGLAAGAQGQFGVLEEVPGAFDALDDPGRGFRAQGGLRPRGLSEVALDHRRQHLADCGDGLAGVEMHRLDSV